MSYEDSNRLLFEVVEYVEPRMKADQAYPPVWEWLCCERRHKLTNEQAELMLNLEFSTPTETQKVIPRRRDSGDSQPNGNSAERF